MPGTDDSWWTVRARLRLLWAPGGVVMLATIAALVVGLSTDGDARSRGLLIVLGADLVVVVGLTLLIEATLRRTIERPLAALAADSSGPAKAARYDSREFVAIASTLDRWSARARASDDRVRRALADVERLTALVAERERALAIERERAAELVRAQDELRAHVDEYARRARLAQADLDQFAHAATHEMQDPLRRIVSFGRMLHERYADVLDRRGTQYIDFTIDNARRLQMLIDEMVTLTEVGRSRARSVDVDLDEIVRQTWADLADRVEDTGAVLEHGDLPVVNADPALLATLLRHLLGNAVKFQRPYEQPLVRVDAAPDPAGWKITVTDNGIGIPTESAERVFAAFQRLHPRETYTGSGIGLAMAKRIVDQHGGWIAVDTAFTGGTRVEFTLPERGTEAEERAESEPVRGEESAGAAEFASSDTVEPVRFADPSNREPLAYVSVASAVPDQRAPRATTEASHAHDEPEHRADEHRVDEYRSDAYRADE
jgi:signal transduction histidine kinase